MKELTDDLIRHARDKGEATEVGMDLLAAAEVIRSLTRELAETRDKALEEAAKVAASSIMKFRRRANGMYYAGYHEDMRDQTAAAIRALKEKP